MLPRSVSKFGWIGYGLAAAPGLLFSLLLAGVSLHEAYLIGVAGDPEVIESYHFGSEAMIAHGGAAYRSAAAYARSALLNGLIGLGFVALFGYAIWRRHPVVLGAGYVALLFTLLVWVAWVGTQSA